MKSPLKNIKSSFEPIQGNSLRNQIYTSHNPVR